MFKLKRIVENNIKTISENMFKIKTIVEPIKIIFPKIIKMKTLVETIKRTFLKNKTVAETIEHRRFKIHSIIYHLI